MRETADRIIQHMLRVIFLRTPALTHAINKTLVPSVNVIVILNFGVLEHPIASLNMAAKERLRTNIDL